VAVTVFAGLWFLAVGVRLVYLQVERHEHYAERAERQQQEMVVLSAPRGTLFDARGRVLAVSVPVDSAYAEPWRIEDPQATAEALVSALDGVEVGKLADRLAENVASVVVKRKLDAPEAERLRGLLQERELPGVYFVEETKRYYPNRALAASVLGFVGTDDTGLAGLEQLYENEVAGRPYRRSLLRDARRETADLANGASRAEAGRDLVLTLDAALQHIVERELERTVERHDARSGSVVMLDPQTGGVLAMASFPSFDPNDFRRFPKERWRNHAIQDAFEPGSTFKMVTAAAALAANVVDPSDVFDCGQGEIRVDGRRIRDHKSFDLLTFRQVMAKSSNVGAIQAGLAVGGGRLHSMIHAFGLGAATGIDLPGEATGTVHPMRDRDRLLTAYVSFGQSVSVTALQLANAFAAVANGGTLYRPHVVAEIGAGKGSPGRTIPTEEIGRPLHPSTARELGRILEGVVAPEGTGQAAQIAGYRVAGKTGTAQTAEAGGYSSTRFVASFVGWVPAREPRLVAAIVIDEPRRPLYHGGQVAAPAFQSLAEQALLALGVPPDEPGAPEQPHVGPVLLVESRRGVSQGYRQARYQSGDPRAHPSGDAGVGRP